MIIPFIKNINFFELAKFMSLQKKSILPKEYKQVNYLESTDNEYIDPDLPLNSDNLSRCTITFAYTELNNDTWISGIFNTYYGYIAGAAPINGEWYTASGTTYEPNIFAVNTIISAIFTYDNSYQSLYLFCRGAYASGVRGPASFAKGKIYHFSVDRNGVLIADMYPCIRKADNKPGMYDIVRNTFYTNANSDSSEFITG